MSPQCGDAAAIVARQVEHMIMQAKRDSEARVSHELTQARGQLQRMEGAVNDLSARVARSTAAASSSSSAAAAGDAEAFVDRPFLGERIAALEQKWGSQVKELSEDLRRTILAHNHNSDLMREHKTRLEEAKRKLDGVTNPKAAQVEAQVEKLDRMLRSSQAKQNAFDDLTRRLATLEKQAAQVLGPAAAAASAASNAASSAALSAMLAASGALPGLFPGVPGQGLLPDMAALNAWGAAAAAGAAGGGKRGAKGADAFAGGAAMGGASSKGFNAEAPVFVPRSSSAAASPTEGAAAGASESADEDQDEADDNDEEGFVGSAEVREAAGGAAAADLPHGGDSGDGGGGGGGTGDARLVD